MEELAEARQSDLTIELHDDAASGTLLLRLAGELDLSNAYLVQQAVDTYVKRPTSRVAFELGDLSFMNSSGLAILLGLRERTTVELRNPAPIVRRVLEATGLTGLFVVSP